MDIDQINSIIQTIGAIAVAIPAIITALIAVFMLIPGDEPEATLKKWLGYSQKIVDVIAKFSRKAPDAGNPPSNP